MKFDRDYQLFFKYLIISWHMYAKIQSRDFTPFLKEYLCFEVALSSEDVHSGQDNLKTQKVIQKMSEMAIAIYLCNIHLSS